MPRLPIVDIMHRGFVTALAGVSVWGLTMMVLVHRETLEKGRELMAAREAAALERKEIERKEEERELMLAEKAQAALQGKSF